MPPECPDISNCGFMKWKVANNVSATCEKPPDGCGRRTWTTPNRVKHEVEVETYGPQLDPELNEARTILGY